MSGIHTVAYMTLIHGKFEHFMPSAFYAEWTNSKSEFTLSCRQARDLQYHGTKLSL